MFELLLVTVAATAVVLSSAQYELRALARELDATNRLISGSVIDASIGLVVAERAHEATSVRWANRAGTAMLAEEMSGQVWSGPLRSAAAAALRSGEQVSVTTDAGRTITVAANAVEGDSQRMTVQLLDVTTLLRARRAQIEAEIEREAARSIRAELERQRDDFLVTTSHELRTPITSIVGYAELLADGDALGRVERGWVQVIARNAQRLSELVEDLLTFSRMSNASDAQIRPERVPCDELFEEVVGNLRPVSEPKRITIEVLPGAPVVFAGRHDASRMLSNLLVNACKFTPEGGPDPAERPAGGRVGADPRGGLRARHAGGGARARLRALLPSAERRARQRRGHRPRPGHRRRARAPQRRLGAAAGGGDRRPDRRAAAARGERAAADGALTADPRRWPAA